MESIQEKETSGGRGMTLADRIRELEEKAKIAERTEETKKKTKQFKFPIKWKRKFMQAKRKINREKMLVFFLNKKNEIEPPKFMPIFEGNMIIWRNKPYEFDPRAVWTVRGMKGNPKAYLIKEIDRRPVRNKFGKFMYGDAAVSNLDLDEVRRRGDSTESDEFLIKAALKAKVEQERKKKLSIVVILIIVAVIGGIIWFLMKGGK